MMGGDESVTLWAERQRSKALHIGTYEAAIHNMLRRIHDQADHGKQFYLYRVRLRPTVALREGWLIDPSNFVGDVILGDVCPPGVDVARYVNHHEDPGGLSLAIGRDAIASTQRVSVPLDPVSSEGEVSDVVADLADGAAGEPPPSDVAGRFARRLPINVRGHFEAASLNDSAAPAARARYVMGLNGLIVDPGRVLNELNAHEIRHL